MNRVAPAALEASSNSRLIWSTLAFMIWVPSGISLMIIANTKRKTVP